MRKSRQNIGFRPFLPKPNLVAEAKPPREPITAYPEKSLQVCHARAEFLKGREGRGPSRLSRRRRWPLLQRFQGPLAQDAGRALGAGALEQTRRDTRSLGASVLVWGSVGPGLCGGQFMLVAELMGIHRTKELSCLVWTQEWFFSFPVNRSFEQRPLVTVASNMVIKVYMGLSVFDGIPFCVVWGVP